MSRIYPLQAKGSVDEQIQFVPQGMLQNVFRRLVAPWRHVSQLNQSALFHASQGRLSVNEMSAYYEGVPLRAQIEHDFRRHAARQARQSIGLNIDQHATLQLWKYASDQLAKFVGTEVPEIWQFLPTWPGDDRLTERPQGIGSQP